eukprot:g2977.t1
MENVPIEVTEQDRSPPVTMSGLETDVEPPRDGVRNVVVSESTNVRGHSLELEMEGELDYEIEDTDLVPDNSKAGGKTNQEKTQPPPQKISWKAWASNENNQEQKTSTEEPIGDQKERRRVREDHHHGSDVSRRTTSRRQYRDSTSARPRSPTASKHPVLVNSGRRTGEFEARSGKTGTGSTVNTGQKIPPGMNQSHGNNSSSDFHCQDAKGGGGGVRHHTVIRGMPPGLGISRNPGPGNLSHPAEDRQGNQWKTGSRFRPRSPPKGTRFDDRPPVRRSYAPVARLQRGRMPPVVKGHRTQPPLESIPPLNRRNDRSPGRNPGPLPYQERSFIVRNNQQRGGRPPSTRQGNYNNNRRRNSGSPRLPNRVAASPRRVTLPVRGPMDNVNAGEGTYRHQHRGRGENHEPQRRPASPGGFRQPPLEIRRGPMPQQPPFRRNQPRQEDSPPLRRPAEYTDRPERRSRGDYRPQGRNHRRSLSPIRTIKRQRGNSQDRRFGPRPHTLDANSPPPHLNPAPNRRLMTPLHHPEMECVWFYVDPRGNTQGPCTIQQFRSWLKTLAEDPQYVDEHQQFRGVSVWREGMHERYSMTELLGRNVVIG